MASFDVVFSFQGKATTLSDVTTETSVEELQERVRHSLFSSVVEGDDDTTTSTALKLIYKGKVLSLDEPETPAFPTIPKKTPKLLVMASSVKSVHALNSKRSDPTIRGFDQEVPKKSVDRNASDTVWGNASLSQDKNYKFCRFQACTWQSFGHRASEANTPHAFEANRLLQKLAHDPGIKRILQERELVVGTLGEMDPIDDRLKQTTEKQGACLLGYNTNHGARIDLKLRPDSLEGFLPYPQIVATLIHELSHNWVGEHNLLFWTNFGQMRSEYLHTHASLAASGGLVNGKTTSELAGLHLPGGIRSIAQVVLQELKTDMVQHGLTPDLIAPAIIDRCRELSESSRGSESGQVVGGRAKNASGGSGSRTSARERALAAAELRARKGNHEEKTKDDV